MRTTTTNTAATRAEAVELARRVGPAEAARRLGHKAATISKWMQRAAGSEGASAAIERISPDLVLAPGNRWQERRPLLIDNMTMAADEALAAVRAALVDNDSRKARDHAVTLGILIDKLQLLSGAPTQRTETASMMLLQVNRSGPQVTARIAELRAELGIGGGDG